MLKTEMNKIQTYKKESSASIKSDTIYLHLIGQLIADEISLPNQWGMLYVTSAEDADEDPEDPEDPGDPSDGDTPKIFSPVYYNLY